MISQLNFWSFAVLLVALAVGVNYWIRARYLNVYAHLKEPPLVKENAQELHPDVNTPENAPGFHNYLDEFLQAVRVFGFLEKPVCSRTDTQTLGVTAETLGRCFMN